MKNNIKIFCWNTQSKNFESLTFIQDIVNYFGECDLAVISLQEDSIRDSIIIPILTEKLTDFVKLDSIELSGWGSTTYKALKNNLEYKPRGLRLTIYKNKKIEKEIKTESLSFVCPSLRDSITWGKGCVAIKLIFNSQEITIANLHLPFSSKSLKDKNARALSADWQAVCLEYIYKTLDSKNLVLTGDFNFRIDYDSVKTLEHIKNKNFKELYKYDELKKYLKTKNINMTEGVDNSGPDFTPTCKLVQKRENNEPIFNIGKYGQRTPSWCDRILYSGEITCNYYDRFEIGDMNLSDHAGIIAELFLNF